MIIIIQTGLSIPHFATASSTINWSNTETMNILVLLLFFVALPHATPRICEIGYGQRGLKYRNSIIWERNCKETDYCFEVVTSDIKKMKPLIDYPWVQTVIMSRSVF